eukprot:250592-Rhodomonas_salina.3
MVWASSRMMRRQVMLCSGDASAVASVIFCSNTPKCSVSVRVCGSQHPTPHLLRVRECVFVDPLLPNTTPGPISAHTAPETTDCSSTDQTAAAQCQRACLWISCSPTDQSGTDRSVGAIGLCQCRVPTWTNARSCARASYLSPQSHPQSPDIHNHRTSPIAGKVSGCLRYSFGPSRRHGNTRRQIATASTRGVRV